VSNKRIIALLEDQLRLSVQREKSLLEQLAQQSTQLRQQSKQIEELTASIRSLEEALLLKNGKITVPAGSGQVKAQEETVAANLKERGNNNAKRKEFFDMETIIEEVYPDEPGFDKEKSRVIGYVF
jgi:transposase